MESEDDIWITENLESSSIRPGSIVEYKSITGIVVKVLEGPSKKENKYLVKLEDDRQIITSKIIIKRKKA